jgi:hypothetical protein
MFRVLLFIRDWNSLLSLFLSVFPTILVGDIYVRREYRRKPRQIAGFCNITDIPSESN